MKKPLLAAIVGACFGCSTPPVTNPDVQQTDAADGGGGGGGVTGDQYCRAAAVSCVAPAVATCGVCVTPPEDRAVDRLQRTSCLMLSGTREFCDMAQPSAAPNLSCFDPANPPAPQTPRMVTLWGVVDVFGNGGDSDNIRVEVYTAMPDGSLGTLLGQAISDTALPYGESEEERNSSGTVTQTRRLGAFQIPNIPTETPLIVRTMGDPMDMNSRDLWGHALVDYTLPVRNSAIAAAPANTGIMGDAVRVRPRVLSNSDWNVIPSTATLTSGIPAGNGGIAGEVHDCDDVRLANATVYAQPVPNFQGTVYFSDNDTRPLPDNSRATHGTQLLGIYAMLDMNPGPVTVAAIGYDPSGNLVHVGSYNARIFPDSITVVTLRGLRPWQLNR